MSSAMSNIRDKMRRRFSHKDAKENTNFDEYESGDEETEKYINQEAEEEEKTSADPAAETRPNYGRSGSLINRMIMHGNSKTEQEIARDKAAYEARQNQITQPTDGITAGKGNVVIR